MTWALAGVAAVLLTVTGASEAGKYVGSHEERTVIVRACELSWAPSPGAGLVECQE